MDIGGIASLTVELGLFKACKCTIRLQMIDTNVSTIKELTEEGKTITLYLANGIEACPRSSGG
jgi:hypothetical protein